MARKTPETEQQTPSSTEQGKAEKQPVWTLSQAFQKRHKPLFVATGVLVLAATLAYGFGAYLKHHTQTQPLDLLTVEQGAQTAAGQKQAGLTPEGDLAVTSATSQPSWVAAPGLSTSETAAPGSDLTLRLDRMIAALEGEKKSEATTVNQLEALSQRLAVLEAQAAHRSYIEPGWELLGQAILALRDDYRHGAATHQNIEQVQRLAATQTGGSPIILSLTALAENTAKRPPVTIEELRLTAEKFEKMGSPRPQDLLSNLGEEAGHMHEAEEASSTVGASDAAEEGFWTSLWHSIKEKLANWVSVRRIGGNGEDFAGRWAADMAELKLDIAKGQAEEAALLLRSEADIGRDMRLQPLRETLEAYVMQQKALEAVWQSYVGSDVWGAAALHPSVDGEQGVSATVPLGSSTSAAPSPTASATQSPLKDGVPAWLLGK